MPWPAHDQTARHWVDAALPQVRTRQWVLWLPFELRAPLAYHHDLALAVLAVMGRAIEGYYRERGRDLGVRDGLPPPSRGSCPVLLDLGVGERRPRRVGHQAPR